MTNRHLSSVLAVFSDAIAKRYALVGLFVTAVSYVFLYLCVAVLRLDNLVANGLTLIFGLSFSYVLNRKFSFADRRMIRASVVQFVAVSGVAYSANLLVLFALLNLTSISSLPAQIIAFTSYTVIAYLLHRFWTFSKVGA